MFSDDFKCQSAKSNFSEANDLRWVFTEFCVILSDYTINEN